VSPSLFDRAEELDALRAAVEAVAEGRGGVTLIEAPPGFGKLHRPPRLGDGRLMRRAAVRSPSHKSVFSL
jgi:hypothetical protein